MKTEIIEINPRLAERLLSKNIANRKVKKNLLAYLIHQMKEGLWRENGESIIIDSDGVIRNGQHRLMATIDANYSFKAVIVTNIDPQSFETIDTGKTRSLADIFYIHGYKDSQGLAATTKVLFYFDSGRYSSLGSIKNDKGGSLRIQSPPAFIDDAEGNKRAGNNELYSYFIKNKEYVTKIKVESNRLYDKQPIKIAANTVISLFLHIIRRGSIGDSSQITEFMNEVLGIDTEYGSAPNFLFRKLLEQKTKTDVKYSSRWINHVLIRAWNDYQDSASVRYYKINVKDDYPNIDRSRLIIESA